MYHKRTIVYASFEYFISSLLATFRIKFVEKLNFIVLKNNVVLYVLVYFFYVFYCTSTNKFINYRSVLVLLALFERDYAVI